MTLEIYIWPAQWGLPSSEPISLALILYLQLKMSSQFVLVESVNLDKSPSGQLPFLRNGKDTVAPLSSILSYLGDEVSTSTSIMPWLAHAESNLGDLVLQNKLHMFYSLHANWTELTHPSIVYRFPIPQRYYVPRAIRDSYKLRLDAAGLWSMSMPETEQEKERTFSERSKGETEVKPKPRDRFLQVFEREKMKVLDKARTTLDLYSRLLGERDYFLNGHHPSLLDCVVAAHVLLLSRPPFRDPLLKDLVNTSYSSLVAHADRLYARAQLSDNMIKPARIEVPDAFLGLGDSGEGSDVWLTRCRFAFAGLTLGGLLAYSYGALPSN
ncbi:hypothetical protein BDP27DRAFT_1415529 [Rhodocollybia butyracea]|uniref:Mitochondrial outer membrane transport complex Sam37/metaxin N-terminal domain-containing protein n=1 Tax=Rhodocollybia butyracea TaxID=206335 RepID=A0A9P5UED3_9AGAR|nr:hypothetical protein BDP27DRAFT_1415529 [Rhodocollybia butyracea]